MLCPCCGHKTPYATDNRRQTLFGRWQRDILTTLTFTGPILCCDLIETAAISTKGLPAKWKNKKDRTKECLVAALEKLTQQEILTMGANYIVSFTAQPIEKVT